MNRDIRFRRTLLILLLIIVPAGFLTKHYTGPAQDWVRNSSGGILYEIFWCLAAALAFPRWRPVWIAAGVFLITCSLEFLQLWHPVQLELLRTTLIGRTILGTSFTWSDFPYYLIGSLGGYWILLRIRRREEKPVP